jgi:hypothetical protein
MTIVPRATIRSAACKFGGGRRFRAGRLKSVRDVPYRLVCTPIVPPETSRTAPGAHISCWTPCPRLDGSTVTRFLSKLFHVEQFAPCYECSLVGINAASSACVDLLVPTLGEALPAESSAMLDP